MNQRVYEVKDIGEFLTVWHVFREGFKGAQESGCVKPMNEEQQMAFMLRTLNRPNTERFVAVMETDDKITGCGCAIVFDGEPWVFIAYAKPGTVNGVKPLLEEAVTWSKMHNFSRLIARSERLSPPANRLFESWGFKQRAIEYQLVF